MSRRRGAALRDVTTVLCIAFLSSCLPVVVSRRRDAALRDVTTVLCIGALPSCRRVVVSACRRVGAMPTLQSYEVQATIEGKVAQRESHSLWSGNEQLSQAFGGFEGDNGASPRRRTSRARARARPPAVLWRREWLAARRCASLRVAARRCARAWVATRHVWGGGGWCVGFCVAHRVCRPRVSSRTATSDAMSLCSRSLPLSPTRRPTNPPPPPSPFVRASFHQPGCGGSRSSSSSG